MRRTRRPSSPRRSTRRALVSSKASGGSSASNASLCDAKRPHGISARSSASLPAYACSNSSTRPSYRGSKYIDGGAGIDTAVYELGRANYSVQLSSDGTYVQGAGSYDLLVNVERVAFSNEGLLAWDANATQMYRLYQAAFDRTPDTAGLSYWVLQADEGL